MRDFGDILKEVIFSLFIGVLPSFLFFSVFNQTKFSLIRYKDFLMDFSSSSFSWVSIIVIATIIYFLLSTIQSGKKKAALLILTIALIIGSVIFFLYANFLLGNDVLVKLSADKENIFLSDSEEDKVAFTISVLMNPFCTAYCEYSFLDISSGEIIDKGSFSAVSFFTKNIDYPLLRSKSSSGQEIKKFEAKCRSEKTRFCYTKKESERSILLTINYDISKEQKALNEIFKSEMIMLENELYNSTKSLEESRLRINEMEGILPTEFAFSEIELLEANLNQTNFSFLELKELWNFQKYSLFEEKFSMLKVEVIQFSVDQKKFISDFNSNISQFNILAENLEKLGEEIEELNLTSLSEKSCIELNTLPKEFNSSLNKFIINSSLIEKEKVLMDLSLKIENIKDFSEDSTSFDCLLEKPITQEKIKRINLVYGNYSFPEFFVKEPYEICCFYGDCKKCCDETCSDRYYPVIFIHGHSVSKTTSADYSLDTFSKIKSELEKEGYIDAGSVIVGKFDEEIGLWGKVNAPIIVTASYYFDIAKSETGEETIIPSKTAGIDTYAIRLNDLVSIVKERTGKEKVIIVAHSMGGLVTRRYIQIFGEESLDKIILTAPPNQGIEGDVKKYCPLIGSKMSCEDMEKNSILMNRLSNAPEINIPVYNIVGIGCDTNGVSGDGIVTEKNQYLEGAKNYYIEGSCNEASFEFLHNSILNPTKHPETVELIKRFLKGED